MEHIIEIKAAVDSGICSFREFITKKIQKDASYLEREFWVSGGSQLTVLNCLIQLHDKDRKEGISLDLIDYIDFVLKNTRDKNLGEPVHQAISAGKVELALYLLKLKVFDVNQRNLNGTTLLSLAIALKNPELLRTLLKQEPNIYSTSYCVEERIPYQPLHEAIMLDFAVGVHYLAKAGAKLDSPVGLMQETPILFASRLGKINSLAELLQHPVEQLNLSARNSSGESPITVLCQLLTKNKANKELIRGIAMLLCHGVEPPDDIAIRKLLANKRNELVQAIDKYLEKKPHLVDTFVPRCHDAEGALHRIIYTDHSWGSSLRRLLGRPNSIAQSVEHFVSRKFAAQFATKAGSKFTGDESSMMLYAEFVRRYEETYRHQRITNPWSSMRWMIADGKCTWDTVLQYSKAHPGTRTHYILNEMLDEKALHNLELIAASQTLKPK